MIHISNFPSNHSRRSGVVLLIVITLLSLFAVVGIGFVIYAESEATAARYAREAESKLRPDMEPELALSLFLSQLILGTTDTKSVLFGEDLGTNARTRPYTYPDGNNWFLAAVTADGNILARSFVRPGLAPLTAPAGSGLTPSMKRAALPDVQLLAGDFDVRNIPFRTGTNDSIWIDPNFPIMTAPNGQKYKMLVAPLIMDLDGKADINQPRNVNMTKVMNDWTGPEPLPFDISHMEAVLRQGDTGSAGMTSGLFRKWPKSMSDPRIRRLVTTLSMSREVAGINVNRPLPNNPTDPNYLKARQDLAMELFQALVKVAGLQDPKTTPNPSLAVFDQWRGLAQLAANIVDFRDDDTGDLTVFKWYQPDTGVATAQGIGVESYVFGVEKPRLLMNELYVQYDNDGKDLRNGTNKATWYYINVWLELYNANTTPEKLLNDMSPAEPVYEVWICKPNTTPDKPAASDILGKMNTWAPSLNPLNPDRYLKVFPETTLPTFIFYDPMNRDPRLPIPPDGFTNPGMGCKLNVTAGTPPVEPILDVSNYKPRILIRRRAIAGLPLNENPLDTTKAFNPLVTIDYLDVPKMWDNREYSSTGATSNTDLPKTKFSSFGRTKTYSALNLAAQTPSSPSPNQPKHTFGSVNISASGTVVTPPGPTDKPVWRDGLLISALDVLQTPSCKPYEFTHKFNPPVSTPIMAGYNEAWFKETATPPENPKLYRIMDYIRTVDAPGGRVQGKININTFWDAEMWEGMADNPQAATLWDKFRDLRWSNWRSNVVSPSIFDTSTSGSKDRPFLGFNAPPVINGQTTSIHNTILAGQNLSTSTEPRWFELASGVTPDEKWAVISKLFDRFTVKSNIFAVWVTVGFFEVKPGNVLGAEIGKSEGRQVRHRMFAIIDRSDLSIPTTVQVTLPNPPAPDTTWKPGKTINISGATYNTTAGVPYKVQVNDEIIIEPGTPQEETVRVKTVGTANFMFDVNQPHAGGVPIAFQGPWPVTVNARGIPKVVRYFSVIE